MLPSPRLAARAASSSASSSSTTIKLPSSLKVVGIILAITSGFLIGSSFVFKKKGLLRSQAGHAAGEGVAYLKSLLWWTGMIMMIIGELCNFTAYAFVEALVVTPMGALSVVISAILASIFLQEKLTFFGWLGCSLCIIGSVIIALNGPQEQTPSEISSFKALFIAPTFLAYISVLITIALSIIFYFGPKYGKNNMIWYITVCSTIGGISVSVTTGLGAAIVATAMGYNQFNNWFIFFLLGFVVVTLLTEVYYLNVALALFNTGARFVPIHAHTCLFINVFAQLWVLFKGLAAPASQIITLVFAFLTICVGITILQMSKIDPEKLTSLDRRSTLLLQAARTHTDNPATIDLEADGEEKELAGLEEPGMGALRGSFGTIGSIMRARSAQRLSQSSRSTGSARVPRRIGVGGGMVGNLDGLPFSSLQHTDHTYDGLTRHALYDTPMPSARSNSMDHESQFTMSSTQSPRRTAIKFGIQDLVHSYAPPGSNSSQAVHALRTTSIPANLDTNASPFVYPPTSMSASPASSILPLPPPPGSGAGAGASSGDDRSVQSIVIPRRSNDEPFAPTVSTYSARSERDPFETPSTPSMSAFPSSNDLLDNGSAPSVKLEGSAGYASSLGSTASGQTTYATPVSVAQSIPVRPTVNTDSDQTRRGRSSSTTRSRRYPKGVDDPEERQSLWDSQSPVEEERIEYPGVRLVQPSSLSASMGGRF
ncbi:magnesium transporter NIPA-domain-containing protein [Boletus reticuloceps]|uniref:Magnesium transporter NIPA-domain-containing protein n=1 Tax=Boletus reticuloceps TaxID=495285 RepID=A0A8I2YRQ8_9AGAM|nr:magnesium transporter NIPA-domain-containing protein [Boletus reticuloceps]